jgi:hypothetical protein
MPLQSRHILNQSVVASLVTLLCIVAVGALQVPHLNRLTKRAKKASPTALQQVLNAEKLRLNLLQKTPAFGFNNLVSNWVFLNFLQYFGDDEARALTGYTLSPEYFEIIVDRDPHFLGAYIGLSTSISLYAGMPEKSVALMEKGLQSMSPQTPPKSYYVWRYKAIDELLFLGEPQAAKQSFEKAAQWASTYSDEESKNIATVSRKTAEFIARNPNSKLAQATTWTMVLSNTIDPLARKIAISRLEALGAKVFTTPQGTIEKILPPPRD